MEFRAHATASTSQRHGDMTWRMALLVFSGLVILAWKLMRFSRVLVPRAVLLRTTSVPAEVVSTFLYQGFRICVMTDLLNRSTLALCPQYLL